MRRAIVHQKRRAVYGPLKKMESGHIPLLASPQGGVAAPIQKMLRSLLSGRSRGGFPFVFNRETTPASRSADASRHFIPRSATPPCRDARRGIRRPLCAIVCATLLSFQPFASAAAQQTRPSVFQEVGIDQRLGAQLDLNLRLRDESGALVPLSTYFDGKPVILAPVYLMCSSLCPMTLNSLVQALRVLTFDAGKDFTVVAFSFDPNETPAMAAAAKAHYVRDYEREGAASGFHFLTGAPDSIRALTETLGFHYKWDGTQWAHATAIMVATPQGKVDQYFYGLEYSARDLRLSLVQASEEKIGNIVDRVLLYCYRYDPATGKYGVVIIRTVRIFGVATALALFTFMFVMFRRDAALRGKSTVDPLPPSASAYSPPREGETASAASGGGRFRTLWSKSRDARTGGI